MITKEPFGEHVRFLREAQSLPLRRVAAVLDIDPSTLSKIERGDRLATKEMIPLLAELFQVKAEDLKIIYLSDKVVAELLPEANSKEILEAAEDKIKYLRAKKTKQESLNFQ